MNSIPYKAPRESYGENPGERKLTPTRSDRLKNSATFEEVSLFTSAG
jgi:hypothetical protein